MSLRIAIICLLSILGGCSSGDSDTSAPEQDSAVSAQSLQFTGGAVIGVLPNMTAALSVRFTDLLGGSLSGVEVDFALIGSAPGSSLSPASATTDATGIARTTLRVGSTTGDLQVRARTLSGVTAYTMVSVTEALGAQLAVTVLYKGQRQLATYTVTALPGMSCDDALASDVAGDVAYTYAVSSADTYSFSLGSGLSAAIVGYGRDASGAKLAQGCQQFTAPITADQAAAKNTLTLTLDNQQLSLDDKLAIELQVDLQAAGTRLANSAQSSVATALAAGTGDASASEADYYLDGVAALLTQQGNSSGAYALASQRAAPALAASLASALSQGHVGPKALASAVGASLVDRGADLTMSTTYQAGVLGPISAVGALSTDGTQQLTLGLTPPVASIVSSFSSELAQLAVSSLRVQLSLGSYGVAVLAALKAESSGTAGATKPSAFDGAAGCSSAFATWWTNQGLASVCDVSVAVAACSNAESTLLTQIQSGLSALDATAGTVLLSGTVQAEDRGNDGQVDDLGPSNLTGSWGADSVTGAVTVPEPAKTAFAN